MAGSFQVRPFEAADEEDVVSLWAEVFPNEPPWNESRALIKQKLTTQPELFFVCTDSTRLIGTAIAGYDGVRGWVHKVASHPDYRGQGVARLLMDCAERALAERGCVKLNLQVRSQNDPAAGFYASIGYQTEERISMSKRLGQSDDA